MSFTIAALDSGLGGITAIAPLLTELHQTNKTAVCLDYFGDLANLPYGSKSQAHIQRLIDLNIRYLLDESLNPRPQILVLACNTASAYALKQAQDLCAAKAIPCVGVIEAACREAAALNSKRVIVLATEGTVASGAYEQSLRSFAYSGEILSVACPLFVPFVEEGILEGPALSWVIRHYLEGRIQQNDTVILGCTHYPFLQQALLNEFPFVQLIHAGTALKNDKLVKSLVWSQTSSQTTSAAVPEQRAHSLEFQFSDNPPQPARIARFLNQQGIRSELWPLKIRRSSQ